MLAQNTNNTVLCKLKCNIFSAEMLPGKNGNAGVIMSLAS